MCMYIKRVMFTNVMLWGQRNYPWTQPIRANEWALLRRGDQIKKSRRSHWQCFRTTPVRRHETLSEGQQSLQNSCIKSTQAFRLKLLSKRYITVHIAFIKWHLKAMQTKFYSLQKPRLNFILSWMLSIWRNAGTAQTVPFLWWSMVLVASCCEDVFLTFQNKLQTHKEEDLRTKGYIINNIDFSSNMCMALPGLWGNIWKWRYSRTLHPSSWGSTERNGRRSSDADVTSL